MSHHVFIITLGAIFAVGLYAYSIHNNESLGNQTTYSISNNARSSIEHLQNRVGVLVKDIEQQRQDYQELKTEVSKLSSLLNTQLKLASTENKPPEAVHLSLSQSAQELVNNNQAGLTNKTELRGMVRSLFAETIMQQHDAIQDQQYEQDELKKRSFADPEQARQYSIDQMSEKLGLNEEQKKAYQYYIESYADLNMELNQRIVQDNDIAGGNADKILEQVTEKLEQEEDSAQQFEEDFVALLDANQEQIYRTLPENERKVIGNRFFTENDF